MNSPLLIAIGLMMLVTFGIGRYAAFRKRRYLAHTEYWVLSDATQIPDQAAIMEVVIGQNPYPNNPIGTTEGLIFSDVRFNIALILAKKNPSAFAPLSELLAAAFGGVKSAIKVQYSSEMKLTNKAHLQFCVHVADAIARSTAAHHIYDAVTSRMWTTKEFQAFLGRSRNATGSEDHVSLIESEAGFFETRGLIKIGVPDIKTFPFEKDKMLLGKQIVAEYVQQSWEAMSPLVDSVGAYGDTFFLIRAPVQPGLESARIMRRSSR